MSEGYVIKDQWASYFLTFQVINWIDIFTRESYRQIIVDAFNYSVDHKHLNVHAWVIMSNHIHCILSSETGKLSDTIRDFKAFTAKEIFKVASEKFESRRIWMINLFSRSAIRHMRNQGFQVWTHENHAIEIDPFSSTIADSRLNYIHQNPVRAGIVENAEDYVYSSAKDYAGRTGLVKMRMW